MDGGRHHARPCLFWSRHRTEKTLPTWLSIQYATGAAWKKNKKSELFFSHKRLFFFAFFSLFLFFGFVSRPPQLFPLQRTRDKAIRRGLFCGGIMKSILRLGSEVGSAVF